MSQVDLDDVQGNILKGFNKPHMRFLFFRFDNPAREASRWIAGIAQDVPSTNDLISASEEFALRLVSDPDEERRESWLHISLSKSGLEKLGLEVPPSQGVYEGRGGNTIKRTQQASPWYDPFDLGMKQRYSELGDRPDEWEEPYRTQVIDALFIVAADSRDDAGELSRELHTQATQSGARCIHEEIGNAIVIEERQFEHFGFRDGISQPLIEGVDKASILNGRNVYRDLFLPDDFVLSRLDGDLAWANNGSFMAFRKLAQDVHGFTEFIRNTSSTLRMSQRELAAKFVGRWQGGAPLASGRQSPADNDFLYRQTDPRGEITPYFSHVRKTNPRDHFLIDDVDNHRILRRGIPYGPKWKRNNPADRNTDRGLLFVCFQRDLLKQFEYIQNKWANDETFPGPDPDTLDTHPGRDPIIGANAGAYPAKLLRNGRFHAISGIQQWVTVKGGEYFFSPSISALEGLVR